MKIRCIIKLEYKTAKEANAIAGAVSIDDYQYVKTRATGRTILAEMESGDIKSLMNTVDDYLACVSVAEKSVQKK